MFRVKGLGASSLGYTNHKELHAGNMEPVLKSSTS